MGCNAGKSCLVKTLLVIAGGVLLFAGPAGRLAEKPANSDQYYVPGWKDGCHSGVNSFSLLGPFSKKPFVDDPDKVAGTDAAKSDNILDKASALLSAPQAKDIYRQGWNEGYTVCRFYQSTLNDFAYMLWIIAALLCVRGRSTKNEA